MIALREIHKVENGRVTIHLPADFPAEQVEVIVLPVRPASSALQKTVEPQPDNEAIKSIESFLNMDTSHFSPDELKAYKRSAAILRKWFTDRESPSFGTFAGLVRIADDFDAPLPEEILALFDGSQTDPYGMSIQG